MKNDAIVVKPLANFQLYVELESGQKGIFDVKPFLEKGALKELQNESYFKQAGISFGAITWPNGQDIAPKTLTNGLNIYPIYLYRQCSKPPSPPLNKPCAPHPYD